MPKRIQLKRSKGWRKPEGAVVVSRPSKWGNPWSIKEALASGLFAPSVCADVVVNEYRSWLTDKRSAYNEHLGIWKELQDKRAWILEHLHELRGNDLACWCPLDKPCHADVLLELANAEGLKNTTR